MDANVEPWIYPLFYPHGTQGWTDNIAHVKRRGRVTRSEYMKYRLGVRNNNVFLQGGRLFQQWLVDNYVKIEKDRINFCRFNQKTLRADTYQGFGTQGWTDNIAHVKRRGRVTRSEYMKYRLGVRNNNIFLQGGRLFQQWLVDNYVKIEKDRINFCRFNQKTLRADTYQGLIDHLQQTATESNTRVGKMVILPSTFTGSPRNMLQHYQDAMAIVRKYGKPDLFITMTCNPNWIEIQENLLPGQIPSDRPDLISRVFNIKKNALIDTIAKKKLFGDVMAYVSVVEYQKRGLPHIHILITLKQNCKITTPEVVDKFILAEIPENDPKLHDIVIKNMLHGPCGDWCKDEKGKCNKNFPKKFEEETLMDENGYPTYKRRNLGDYFRTNGCKVNNQYVVPYNSTLLKMFNCHINVEVVSSIKSVKYVYKYTIYKGHNAATVVISDRGSDETLINHDEINNYLETRYVGPVEAYDRILGRSLQEKSHSIIRLPVHLPNQQSVIINGSESNDSIRAALEKQTMLLDYFRLNERDPEARKFTYAEIPSHFVYKKTNESSNCNWQKRKTQFNVIGRMYSVSLTQVELFHLRLLLISVKSATSFEDLLTVNGIRHDSFQNACLALGLIEDDAEWNRAMLEGENWMMPAQLRRLFIRILLYCQPNNPKDLWEIFKDSMSEDFQRNNDILISYRHTILEFNNILSNENLDISKFPFLSDVVNYTNVNIDSSNNFIIENHEELGQSQYLKLNCQQESVVDMILEAVLLNKPSSYFYIDGPGGSAILLPHGKTLHKTFGMPVPLFSDSVSNFKSQSKDAEYLKQVDVFIWDEAPMAPRYALELIDRTLRDFMNVDLPFGGKVMVLGGDFRQLLPVKIHATRSEMVNLSIKFSSLWKNFSLHTLTKNMRTLSEETEFAKFLLSVGDGILNDKNNNLLLPEKCVASKSDDIVRTIFGSLIVERKYENLSKVAILAARNIDVEEINCRVVELLDKNTEKIYTSVDSVKNCDNGEINDGLLPEYLNTLNPPNFPPYELRLRVNCIVMLVRNLSINEGLCNGTRLQVLELANNLLRCKILTGDKAGDVVFIHRIDLYCENLYPFTFKRRQFPIKLAFAMTINKSQGQTFDMIGIDLRKDVFNHGQLYVAFSRVRSWESLKIFLGSQRTSNIVKNYVYKELYV
ncbi:uncharacterized protein LOC122499439 [Leptopilina heterotoma]|uniref:uncharacterized protein LOC122499439 n=1 Tax=Leptopilina heterotoma TaxID=63436 RepID=UPI001CA98494|nr:uncharacterized protein LOC122499439 [Leptopilina heterotoma]